MKSFSEKLSSAKKVPIQEIYPHPGKQIGNKIQTKCIFHADNGDPNFFIYTETNTFYCFRCGERGDVISIYQKLHNVDFKTALRKLAR